MRCAAGRSETCSRTARWSLSIDRTHAALASRDGEVTLQRHHPGVGPRRVLRTELGSTGLGEDRFARRDRRFRHRLAGQDVLLIAVMVVVGEVRQIGIVTHIVPAPSQAIG